MYFECLLVEAARRDPGSGGYYSSRDEFDDRYCRWMKKVGRRMTVRWKVNDEVNVELDEIDWEVENQTLE